AFKCTPTIIATGLYPQSTIRARVRHVMMDGQPFCLMAVILRLPLPTVITKYTLQDQCSAVLRALRRFIPSIQRRERTPKGPRPGLLSPRARRKNSISIAGTG